MQLLSEAQALPSEPQKCTRGQICAQSRSSVCAGVMTDWALHFPSSSSALIPGLPKSHGQGSRTQVDCVFPSAQLSPASAPGLASLRFQPASPYHRACWGHLSFRLPRVRHSRKAIPRELCRAPRTRRSIRPVPCF